MRKIFFIALPSVLAFLVILEISLRLSGYIYLFNRNSQTHSKAVVEPGTFNILCLGDSYTYGMGATFEYSYPGQLAQMLNADTREKKINVRNLGSPGGNSFRILKIFGENIPKYNPDVAIVMVGMNNDWNLEGMQRFYQKGVLNRFKSCVYDLRIYKLWEILSMSLKNRMAKTFQDSRPLSFKNQHINHQINNQPIAEGNRVSSNRARRADIPISEWQAYMEKFQLYKAAARVDLALEETRNMLAKYPDSSGLNAHLALLSRETGDYDLALEYAKKALEYSTHGQEHNAYIHLELLYDYMAKKDYNSARQEVDLVLLSLSLIQNALCELRVMCKAGSGLSFDKEIESFRKLTSEIHGQKGTRIIDTLIYLDGNRQGKLRIIENDLSELIRISRRNNIKIVLMTYPMIGEHANEAMRKIASKFNVPLIDNESQFMSMADKDKFFNLDRHCNAKGYRVLAQNAYNVLTEYKLLPGEK